MRTFSNYCLLLLAFMAMTPQLNAQLVKGDQLLSNTDDFILSSLLTNQPTASNLGSLLTGDDLDGAILTTAVKYGFAVSDDIVVGTGFLLLNIFEEEGGTLYAIAPYGRYYFKNDPNLLVFGGLQVAFLGGDEILLSQAGTTVTPSAGLSLPVTSGLLFSPELGYSIGEGANRALLNLQLEFVLGRNTRGDGKAISSLGKGSLLFGALAGIIALSGEEGPNVLNFSPSLRYFVGKRFALGAGIGLSRQWNDFFSVTNTLLEFSGRYYLSPNKHFTPFLQAGLALAGSSFSNDFFGSENNSELAYDLALGGNIWLRDNLALEVGLGARFFPESELNLFGPSLGAVFAINK